MVREVKIGLVGFGTVGSGVYQVLRNNQELLTERTETKLTIKSICDLQVDKVKSETENINVTNKWQDLVNDPEISIIVELIGGIEPAQSIIMSALENGKSVVTANKKLLAEKGAPIFKLAREKNVGLGFEASVGGGIPCILALREGLVANNVQSIVGILNGTTNYILTRMAESGLSFEDALKEAQLKGFAELDPTFDIEGYDAGHKIALLTRLAYNRAVDYNSMSITGITKISDLDMQNAKEMGYVIKLLGISKMVDGEIDIRVHPAMVPQYHPLAAVRNEFNAVMYTNDMTGPVTLYGKGAGSLPTASAVVSDIVAIASGNTGVFAKGKEAEAARSLNPGMRRSRYYVRLHTEDRSGILAQIAGVLAKYDISISSLIQNESAGDFIPLILMTHYVQEDGMMKAVADINNFDFVNGEVTVIRVEDFEGAGE